MSAAEREDGLAALRELSDAASPGPWHWLDGEDEGDELQDGHGEMVATGFRENLVFDGKPINRDGSFAAAAVNYVRAALRAADNRSDVGLKRDDLIALLERFFDPGDYGSGSSDPEGAADAILAALAAADRP